MKASLMIASGVIAVAVVALAVLGTLWALSQIASADPDGSVTLVHVKPTGTDYTGNPYCPDTDWSGGKNAPVVNPWHDCNNITSQNHVIRTEGWVGAYHTVLSWNVENIDNPVGSAVATIQASGRCGDIAEVIGRAGWGTANNDEQCLVIHSSTPGETHVTLAYDADGIIIITPPVVKEWDTIVGSVILKGGDEDLVKVYYDADGDTVIASTEYKWMYLPKDVNGDGVRDADDEHLLDKQGAWQDHGVVFDEALKRIKSPVPVQITEIVHGEHEVLINAEVITLHHPTEGALILAEIESERNCTFFTDSLGTVDLGATIQTTSDNLGRATVYIDTVCEEQAIINFYAQYPNLPGSVREGLHEWIGINWTTIELAKQPQIRWAGEEIVLAKRWALPGDWYPNVDATGADKPFCPLATIGGAVYSDTAADPDDEYDTVVTHEINYVLKDPDLGALEGGYIDINGDGVLDTLSFLSQSEAIGHIDNECISKALADSEEPGQQDIEAKLMQVTSFCPMGVVQGEPAPTEVVYRDGKWVCALPNDGPTQFDATLVSEVLINKHAFLVWYLKVYQVRLTNVDGARANHNDGKWAFGDGEDTVADTLNVSQDALLRVKVKGWFESGNLSGRGDVCLDMDGDGDGAGSDPGEPYPAVPAMGCADPDDQLLLYGHWVLPDDLPLLAGPDAINTRPNWDVMSEADASSTGAVGPKSTLDSHDNVLRPWLDRKTVVPDGAITAADAIMPPLKIRARIADGDAGFLKEALKSVVYGSTNDYHSIMIPASPEIPAIVNNGGYDWMSWDMPPCSDADMDGVCDDVDRCPAVFDPTNADTDSDGVGDVCDTDADGDTILDDGDASGTEGDANCVDGDTTLCDDNCPLNANATQMDADSDGVGTVCDADDAVAGTPATDLDSDGDTVLDAVDNCPAKSNATQVDTDLDGYGDACDANPSLPWWAVPPVPYPFWTITGQTGAPYPYYIEFYTDNRGEGMFFANGDYNLSFDDCRTDPVSGAPDCSPGDVVGESNITVIGDYPYFRKHSAVQSNPVLESWEWGGFKTVTAERLDANHIAIIAHLKDRDGYCKYQVKSDPTASNGVTFSPSLNPVQGEEIEFILNTPIGSIIDVSPNALYNAPHTPLGTARVIGLADGVIINRSDAVALAEDERVLDFYGEARPVREDDECQAWIVIEHPATEDPDVSIIFHDPEGVIFRHWPPSELLVSLVPGWNDSCYVGPEQPVDDAVADIAEHVYAIYRLRADQGFDRWFPGRPDISTIITINPYDPLIILMAADAGWLMDITTPPAGPPDLLAGWNRVCYTGPTLPVAEATADWDDFAILYRLQSETQVWCRYIPDRPDISNCTDLTTFDSVFVLVAEAPELCGPVFPTTFNGTVTVDDEPAADGTFISAIGSDGITWAQVTTSGGTYAMNVPYAMPVTPPCFAGGTISFQCDGLLAAETGEATGGLKNLNLTCGQPPPEVTVRVDQGISIDALRVPAPGLGAFTIDATYSPAVLTPVECTAGPEGSFDMALCTPDFGPNTIRATGIRAECGLTGDVRLAEMIFEPTSSVCPDDLQVSVETLANCEGNDVSRVVDHKWWVGDADRDFDKDAVDALFILQYVVGMRNGSDQCPPPTGNIHLQSADADCDGDVDAVDALFVLQHVVGLRPMLCPQS